MLKTHERIDLTETFKDQLTPCKIHGVLPTVTNVVAGRQKESHYVVTCGSDNCTKLTMDNPQTAVSSWIKSNKQS